MVAAPRDVLKNYLQGARDVLLWKLELVDLYRRVQAFADETIDALPLDAVGHVAHWNGEAVTLHEIMVHKTVDLQRHAGHADILREQLDGSVGLLPGHRNLPDPTDWPAYMGRLTAIANRFD